MKKGMKKCNKCGTVKKGYKGYKKKSKWFCTKKCKKEYYADHIPTLKKKIQPEFNSMVTEGQACAKCGKKFEKMDCSHVLSRGAHDGLRFDILNVLPMCSRCHRWEWHDNPLEAIEWFKNTYPKRYDYLMFAKNQFRKWTASELKEIRKAVKEKDRNKLVRFKDEYSEHKKGV